MKKTKTLAPVRKFRYDIILIISTILLLLTVTINVVNQQWNEHNIDNAHSLLNSDKQYSTKQIDHIKENIERYKKNIESSRNNTSLYVSLLSTMTAITSLIVAIDSTSKRKAIFKENPRLILNRVTILNSNEDDLKVFTNMSSMDIENFTELQYIKITKAQYENLALGKYVAAGESVSFSNSYLRDSIYRYVKIAVFVDDYVIVQDGYYRLELNDSNTYITIQKHIQYRMFSKKKFDKIQHK